MWACLMYLGWSLSPRACFPQMMRSRHLLYFCLKTCILFGQSNFLFEDGLLFSAQQPSRERTTTYFEPKHFTIQLPFPPIFTRFSKITHHPGTSPLHWSLLTRSIMYVKHLECSWDNQDINVSYYHSDAFLCPLFLWYILLNMF